MQKFTDYLKSYGSGILLGLFLQLLISTLSQADTSEGRLPEEQESPGMLARVDRRPGILEEPSEVPTGDQADLYINLGEN